MSSVTLTLFKKLKFLVPISEKIDRPENGWDPVSQEYAETYAKESAAQLDLYELDELEKKIGSFQGKRVLDLGGGPGVFTIPMALRGAKVTWFDASRNYQNIVKQKAAENNVHIDYDIGRLEDIKKYEKETFDIIFCRVCWFYNVNDYALANIFLSLIKNNGYGYISTHTRDYCDKVLILQYVSDYFQFIFKKKLIINHKPKGYMTKLFAGKNVKELCVDMSVDGLERVLFKK
jgi:2-polyprenyl-3-methyl-5-hydroxy-6-metoxy-1,4-benzoquinol methylase